MADTLSREKRSWNMSRIRSEGTQPEILVRCLLHSDGYRFRLHKKSLPGKPDIVLNKYNTIVFVHGCFWHRHKGCSDGSIPKTRALFWRNKLNENVRRDNRTISALQDLRWSVIVVWECETLDLVNLLRRLRKEIRQASNNCMSTSWKPAVLPS